MPLAIFIHTDSKTRVERKLWCEVPVRCEPQVASRMVRAKIACSIGRSETNNRSERRMPRSLRFLDLILNPHREGRESNMMSPACYIKIVLAVKRVSLDTGLP